MARTMRVSDLGDERLKVFSQLTNRQLRGGLVDEGGVLVAESRMVVEVALDEGVEPLGFLVDERDLESSGGVLARAGDDVPAYVLPHEQIEQLTGFRLTRGLLCAMRRPRPLAVGEVLKGARRVVVVEDLVERMQAEGHQVGSHTWSHVRLNGTQAANTEEIQKTETVLEDILVWFNHCRTDAAEDDMLFPSAVPQEVPLWRLYRNTAPSGVRKELFVTDCLGFAGDDGSGDCAVENVSVWGRCLDTEHVSKSLYSFRRSDVWIFGFKSENSVTLKPCSVRTAF